MNNITDYKVAINDKALVKKFTQDLEKHCLKRIINIFFSFQLNVNFKKEN